MITAAQAKDIASDDTSIKTKLLDRLHQVIVDAANAHLFSATFQCHEKYQYYISDILEHHGFKYEWIHPYCWKDESDGSYFNIYWN